MKDNHVIGGAIFLVPATVPAEIPVATTAAALAMAASAMRNQLIPVHERWPPAASGTLSKLRL
jgi:hypothetical protein